MRIAVTGGRGGIGLAVSKMALEQGHEVVSIDRDNKGKGEVPRGAKFIKADVAYYQEMESAIKGCDALIHLAAIPTPEMGPDYTVHNNNVTGSYNALSAAVRLGIKKVCQASSINAIGAAYSRKPRYDYFPLDEEHPTYNEDPYSLSKWICEAQGDSMARRYEDMTITSLRFHWVVSDRAFAAENNGNLRDALYKHLWAYTTFDAAARACLLSLTAPFTGHEVFFIVAPDTTMEQPSRELAETHFPNVPIRGELQGNASFFNSTKAERLLGWKHYPSLKAE